MFLADDAPHSIRLFHESNGDKDVFATPWRKVDDDGIRSERTMRFQTRISPGSSSNPLSSQSARANGGGGGNNPSAIPLGVVISQTLVRHLAKTWVLECEFAFDFYPPAHGGVDAARPPPSDRPNNGGNGGNGKVGKKFSAGLGQYFISNAVKGTTVNMAILLGEGDDATANEDGPASTTTAIDGGDVENGRAYRCWHNGMMSCLVHPLLLPPDRMCGLTSGGGGGALSRTMPCTAHAARGSHHASARRSCRRSGPGTRCAAAIR